jgi:hypothetical protein
MDKSDLNTENNARKRLEENNKKDGVRDTPLKSIDHAKPPSAGQNPDGPMNGELMTFTQMLENIAAIQTGIDYTSADDTFDGPVDSQSLGGNDEELLNQLNQIFTPILVMQNFEGDITDRIQEACSEENALLERNIINFDDATRMAQLISVCALLIAKQQGTQQYQMYKQASKLRTKMKLEIQKQHYEAAKTLATKFLVKVSTTSIGPARDAAKDLLPATQH